jgi:hypothetical protein
VVAETGLTWFGNFIVNKNIGRSCLLRRRLVIAYAWEVTELNMGKPTRARYIMDYVVGLTAAKWSSYSFCAKCFYFCCVEAAEWSAVQASCHFSLPSNVETPPSEKDGSNTWSSVVDPLFIIWCVGYRPSRHSVSHYSCGENWGGRGAPRTVLLKITVL